MTAGHPELQEARAGRQAGLLLIVLFVLTATTGVVDAVSYLALGHVFVANMTGNVVFLGFAFAGGSQLSISASLVALAAFLGGAVIGGRLGVALGRTAAGCSRQAFP